MRIQILSEVIYLFLKHCLVNGGKKLNEAIKTVSLKSLMHSTLVLCYIFIDISPIRGAEIMPTTFSNVGQDHPKSGYLPG